MFKVEIDSLVGRLKGLLRTDGQAQQYPVRLNSYQDVMVQPNLEPLLGAADEGSVFVAMNPTPETPIAVTTSIITYAETSGAVGVTLLMRNGSVAGTLGAKNIVPLFIKLMLVQVPTSATHWKYVLATDDNPARYTSGGSAITTIFNVNGNMPNTSVVAMQFGALTTGVPTNRRLVGRGNLRGVIPTTFDQYIITFGANGSGQSSGAAASGSFDEVTVPVVLSPGQNLALTMWGIGNAAAPSWEFMVAWIEK